MTDTLRIGTFNLKDGGGDTAAGAWAMLAEQHLDVLLMQELPDDVEALAAAEAVLGMTGTIAGGNRGRLHTGLFTRPEVFSPHQAFTAEKAGRIRPTDVTVHLTDRPDITITLVSLHLSYCSPPDRLREAYALVPVADKAQAGQLVIIGGDFNELPTPTVAAPPHPDWSTITDHVHRVYRARRTTGGGWETITDVDQVLTDLDLIDIARYLGGDHPDALAATAGHHRPDQGGGVRLDRLLIPDWAAAAATTVEVTDTGHSDHHLVTATLSRTRLIELIDTHPARRPATPRG